LNRNLSVQLLYNLKFPGVNIGYGNGVQTSVDAVKVSASQSKMNINETTYQNGRCCRDIKKNMIRQN